VKEEELRTTLKKYGYMLEKVTRFKNHDRLRIITPNDPILKSPLIITLTLKKHLEDIPRNRLLEAILSKDELRRGKQ